MIWYLAQVLGGRPSPRVSWWRDHHLADDSFLTESGYKVTNQLVIPEIAREDLHSIFTCQAANNNVSVPVSTSVKLDITCNALLCLSLRAFSNYNVFIKIPLGLFRASLTALSALSLCSSQTWRKCFKHSPFVPEKANISFYALSILFICGRFLDTRLTSRFTSLRFSWSEWPQTTRGPRLSVRGASSRGQVRGRGCEARPRHHLVEGGEAADHPDYPGSLPAPGENKFQERWFIQSAHNSAWVSGISEGFNHTKCFDFSRMESRLFPNLANSYSTQLGWKYAF